MITGITMGIIAWASMLASFMHFPNRIKKFLLSHFLITDLIATGLTYTFLSGISKSIAAVLGSLTCGLLVNFSLMANEKFELSGDLDAKPSKPTTTNP